MFSKTSWSTGSKFGSMVIRSQYLGLSDFDSMIGEQHAHERITFGDYVVTEKSSRISSDH